MYKTLKRGCLKRLVFNYFTKKQIVKLLIVKYKISHPKALGFEMTDNSIF